MSVRLAISRVIQCHIMGVGRVDLPFRKGGREGLEETCLQDLKTAKYPAMRNVKGMPLRQNFNQCKGPEAG